MPPLHEIAAIVAIYATWLVVGRLLVALLGGPGARGGAATWARALLLGPGALAVQMGIYHGLGIPFTLPALLLPWWLVWAAWRWRRGRQEARGAGAPRWLWATAGAIAAITWLGYCCVPIHDGDAIHNFATIAVLFAEHGSLAPDALAGMVDPGHNEYPPLLALNEALVFLASRDAAPWALSPLFAQAHLAMLWLAVAALWNPAAPRRSALLTVVAIAAPGFAVAAGIGTPDLRLAATVLLLGLEARAVRTPGGPLRCAAVAGLAALTKNEGIAIAAAAGLWLAWRAWREPALRRGLGAALALLAVLAGSWPWFRAVHGIRAQFLEDALAEIDLGAALGRLPVIVEHFAGYALLWEPGFGSWGLLWPLALALGAVAAARGSRQGRHARGALAAAGAHLALYGAVFSISPFEVRWHLGTAAGRLLLHTTPWLLLALGAWNWSYGLPGLGRARPPGDNRAR